MSENKTTKNNFSVKDFLHTIEDESKRKDAYTVLQIMQDIT